MDQVTWQAVQDAGFAGLCLFLIYWVLRTTDAREKSFRERETEFLKLMDCYAEQMKQFNAQQLRTADVLNSLVTKVDQLNTAISGWSSRRTDKGER